MDTEITLVLYGHLLKAKWIGVMPDSSDSSAFPWTDLGRNRRFLLVTVVETFNLKDPGITAASFTRSCEAKAKTGAMDFEQSARSFWMSCHEELSLPHEEKILACFVELICSAEP